MPAGTETRVYSERYSLFYDLNKLSTEVLEMGKHSVSTFSLEVVRISGIKRRHMDTTTKT